MRKKGIYFLCLLAVLAIGFTSSSAHAKAYDFGCGQELSIMGYVTQNAQYGIRNDYNTEHGFNQLLTSVLAEADYRFADTAKFYVSGMFTADWIYDVKNHDSSWNDKMFNQSRVRGNSLYMDNEYWQLLKEAHITWNPGPFFFRFGKQIVVWGETIGFRLMDQINPVDNSRGVGDVEFETSIIPIWLVRAEYNAKVSTTWLTDLNFQFVFNPNVTFIPNQGTAATGNDAAGIWAPQINVNVPFLGMSHIGSSTRDIDRPSDLSSDGFDYAFKVSGNVLGGAASLNYYYGHEKDPVAVVGPGGGLSFASDGRPILNGDWRGFYPLFRFVGATYAHDLSFARVSALGGVAPIIRFESIYAFQNTFGMDNGSFIHSDEFRLAVGLDYKVKIPALNERAYFTINPLIYYRRIMDYPSVEEATGIKDGGLLKTNYTTVLMMNTNYMHSKLTPMFVWMRDWRTKSEFFKLQFAYAPNESLQYAVGTMMFDGSARNSGLDIFSNKDYVYAKISYKWQ